jgi:hypothetical protein
VRLHYLTAVAAAALFASTTAIGTAQADVGTADSYPPHYAPTKCSVNNENQLPSSNLFAAAGEGIWDHGAACGRQYLVKCISAAVPHSCNGQIIRIRIVDYCDNESIGRTCSGATMTLSTRAFNAIVNPNTASKVNIDFQQV